MRQTVKSFSPFWKQFRRTMRRYWQLILYGAIFVLGVALGVWAVKACSAQTLGPLNVIITRFVERRQLQGFAATFMSSAGSNLLFLGALFVAGFCAIAQPVVLLVPLFKGLGFGVMAGYLYAAYRLAGVGYVAATLLPGALISAVVLLFACREALALSLGFIVMSTAARQKPLQVREYCIHFVGFLLVMLLAAAVDAGANFLLAGLFRLG